MPDQSSAASEHAILQEITAPLQTLPDDPLALVEAEFPTAMRGYDRHAVDAYVEQMSRLVAELHATRSPESAVRRALERVGDQISGILQRAHETAEQITAQSRVEAEDRLEQARREAGQIVDAAELRVHELDADTDRIWAERQRIVADAEELSGQLLAVAHDAADRFPAEEARPAAAFGAHPAARDDAVEADGALDEADEDLAAQAARAGDIAPLELEPDEPAEPDAPPARPEPPEPRRTADDAATRIIPPSSEAAHRRHDP